MRRSSKPFLLTSLFMLCISQVAHADESTLILNLPVLIYGQTRSTTKPNEGDESKETTADLKTADMEQAFIAIQLDDVVFYAYPFTPDASLVSVGYMMAEDLEVGIDLGLNSSTAKESESTWSSRLIGIYAAYTHPVGTLDTEFSCSIDSTTDKGKIADPKTGEEVSMNAKYLNTKLMASIIVPLNDNLKYTAGLLLNAMNVNNLETESKTTQTTVGLNLATLRLTLD